MTDPTAVYTRLRPRLEGIAYRMLGSMTEAEDIVQDVWLTWHGIDVATIDNPEAWLVTATTRRSIDRLRVLKQQREQYVGLWLPEPILGPAPQTPEDIAHVADNASVAFLTVLEKLTPEARAAFLLREAFDQEYEAIGVIIGKTPAACRQVVSRSKALLKESAPWPAVPTLAHKSLLRRFADALERADFTAMLALLDEHAEFSADGGGKVSAFARLVGRDRIARLFYAGHLRFGESMHSEPAMINGEMGMLRFVGGALESAQSFVTDGERILRIYVQRNPDKLAGIVRQLSDAEIGAWHATP